MNRIDGIDKMKGDSSDEILKREKKEGQTKKVNMHRHSIDIRTWINEKEIYKKISGINENRREATYIKR